MTKIDVISGFLGAGKTTLIKKLLTEAIKDKVVLIENEFGEIGVDGTFLKDAGVQIREINSGCICCSLVGDFEKSLKEVIDKFSPERIIIEPSGVGKLTDIIEAINKANLDININSLTTVVDGSKCKMYMKNFGEFFNNQIQAATTVIISRVDKISQEKIEEDVELIKGINGLCRIITTPLGELSGEKILKVMENNFQDLESEMNIEIDEEEHEHHHHHHEDGECCCGHHHHDDEEEHEHHHHHEDGECCCGHHHHDNEDGHEHHHHHHHGHDADEVFTSIGIETVKVFTKENLEEILKVLSKESEYGMVLRAKGVLRGENCWLHFDLTPEEYEIREGLADFTGRCCVIGANLKEEEIRNLFK